MNDLDQQKYTGILPSPPDPRDYSIEDIPLTVPVAIPIEHKLRSSPLILDQKSTPFCAGASGAAVANAHFHTVGEMPDKGFSMTFLYWLSKQYDGIPHIHGTYLRTLLKVMNKYGCAPETLMPFAIAQQSISTQALREANNYKIHSYARLNSVQDIKQALLKNCYVLIGTLVTRTNWHRSGGYLSYPQGELYGGHATHLFGYDDNLQEAHRGYFRGQNSWGEQWGDKGRFYLPYAYYRMSFEGRPAFLEAWAVKFVDDEPKKKVLVPSFNPRQTLTNVIERWQNRITDLFTIRR